MDVITVLECPHCGAGLPREFAVSGVHMCAYCKRALLVHAEEWRPKPSVEIIDPPIFPGRPRVTVAGVAYVIEGRIASGEGCDVLLARRDARITERVVLKVVRALADSDLLAREWAVLQSLHDSRAQGAEHFTTLLPQPVAHGPLTPSEPSRLASVFRWRSGFVHTFEDIRSEHPRGVDPQTAVWLWKRTLELLGFVHRSGYVHGAVLPRHLLVHARDHGVVLTGYSRAVRYFARSTEALPARSADAEGFYPEDVWAGAAPDVATDLTMAARSVLFALGADPAKTLAPDTVPEPIAALLNLYASSTTSGRSDDAWALMEQVGHAGKLAYGPPRYHKLSMPGWR